MSKAPEPKGFTLIELLLVAMLLGIVGLTIVATFAGGLKIFNRVENQTAVRADILLAAEKIERDLRNTFAFQGIDFIGETRRVIFPSIIGDASGKGASGISLGSVSCFRDDNRKQRVLSREEKSYALTSSTGSSGRGQISEIAPIDDVEFQYLSYDPEADSYAWVDTWGKSGAREERKKKGGAPKGGVALEDMPEDLPLGVKIKFHYREGDKILTLDRTVFLKTAVSLNRAKKRAKAEKRNSGEAKNE